MQHLWSHTRRGFERAKDSEPEAVAEALALIGAMYAHEEQIRADALTGEDKRAYRQTHTRPVVETFWRWCDAQCHRPELLPKSPLAKALNYARERRSGLEVFLDDPEVAIDMITWSGRYVRFRSGNETGCSLRARSAHSASASSRVCW